MKTLDKYLLKEYLVVLLSIFVGTSAILAVALLFDELDTLIKYGPGLGLSLKFILLYLPNDIATVVPIIMLLSAFYFLHRLNNRNELVECFVAGFSPGRLMVPMLLCSFVISGVFFYFQESVVSWSTARAQDILEVEIKGGQKLGRARTGNWLRGANNRMYHVPLYDTEEKVLHGIWMIALDPTTMKVSESFRADRGVYVDGTWNFENCIRLVFEDNRISKREEMPSIQMDLEEEPEDFAGVQLAPDEMGYFQLRELIRNLGLSGEILRRYRAEMAYKLALPLSCFVLTLVGMAWSLRPQFSGVSVELLATIVIGAAYMALTAFFLSLGGKGAVPPIVAGWLSTVIYLGFGVALLIKRQFFPFA